MGNSARQRRLANIADGLYIDGHARGRLKRYALRLELKEPLGAGGKACRDFSLYAFYGAFPEIDRDELLPEIERLKGIRDNYAELNKRRCDLIHKEYEGRLKPEERGELEGLQKKWSEYLNIIHPINLTRDVIELARLSGKGKKHRG